jgi:hypothetical protein
MTIVASVSLQYLAGNDIALEFTVSVDDEAIDISQMTPSFAIARDSGSAVISTDDATATAEVTDGPDGVFEVTIAGEDTAALAGTYRWQANLEDALGSVSTVARGYVTFKQGIISESTTA